MENQYILVSSTFGSGDKSLTGYGIALVNVKDDVMSVLQTISDISGDKIKVAELVEYCNELELDCVHLDDIVQDFLADV